MVHFYAKKGHKRKQREGTYYKEEIEQFLEEDAAAATASQDEDKAEEVTHELPGKGLFRSCKSWKGN